MIDTNYDVVIIGAGPNGLATGAYLSKAGLKVMILEKRYESGGGLATEEVTYPNFFHNTHSKYHMMVDFAPPYKDFDLAEKYNCKYLRPELQFAMPLLDGRALCIYTDIDKTCESIARFSKSDAENYREFSHKLAGFMDAFLGPATYAPPLGVMDQVVKLQGTSLGKEILSYSEKSAKEIVYDVFENETVRTLMLYAACNWGVEYDTAGIGYLALIYLNRITNYRLCVGGSHMVGQALNKIVHEYNGAVINNCRVKRIIVENGTAKGVELTDGTIINASKAVISSLDTHQTFLKYIDDIDEDFAEKINAWQWEKWSLFENHIAFEEPPDFSVAKKDPELNKACVYVLGYETTEDLISHWDSIYKGELKEDAGFNCSFPSEHDPSQAPKGRCTGVISQMAPYDLKDGGAEQWYSYKFKKEHADRCIDLLSRYAPNITQDKIFQTYMISPLGIENRFNDMVKGSIKQGAYHPLQMGFMRPNEECSRGRTPIDRLYLCGSCCYPGGLITFGSGYLAANALAEDIKLEKWWSEPEYLIECRKSGLL